MTSVPIVNIGENLRIIGTAHISRDSADVVKQQIAEWKPDVVAVELDEGRLSALRNPEAFDEEALSKVIKSGRTTLVLFQSLLSVEQRKMGLEVGEQVGVDLLAAIETAEEADIPVELVDRDIQITLKRAWKRMKISEKWRILYSLLGEEPDEEDIDVETLLGDSDLITQLMEELRTSAPGAGSVLVDERDDYLAGSIEELRGERKVLAVIGAGHLEGVSSRLQDGKKLTSDEWSELKALPSPNPFWKFMKWGFPIAILGLFAYLLLQGNYEQLLGVAYTWLALNAALASLGALLARGHPLAILTAAIASPITSLNPTLAAGWFAGAVQMKMAKPTAGDLQDFLKLDEFNLFWRNRVGRVLLVTALANLGSSVGAYLAGTAILGTLIT
ncbi:MAG: conjugal transfer protein TraB [Euryarchaeota archaeon]|jgi:pheromone shutdown-related protein TraB|nr:conjugal transfer protein TraB [Euryarchaeota archaeon]MDP6379408.1 TraB/GumN family protein [Candidatus Thalassarchaeaceae archaeon]|tara:strand:- start:238 stop:1401 length:1164 start_codon:yes stop_codon:yes gene_type:complete